MKNYKETYNFAEVYKRIREFGYTLAQALQMVKEVNRQETLKVFNNMLASADEEEKAKIEETIVMIERCNEFVSMFDRS